MPVGTRGALCSKVQTNQITTQSGVASSPDCASLQILGGGHFVGGSHIGSKKAQPIHYTLQYTAGENK